LIDRLIESLIDYRPSFAFYVRRDAVHIRGLCRRNMSVCPSVYLSVTGRYSVETGKHLVKLFHRRIATQFCIRRPFDIYSFSISNGMVILR